MSSKKEEIYLKKKNHEINSLKNEIKETQILIEKIEIDISEKKGIFSQRENEVFEDSIGLLTKDLFLKSLIEEIESLNNKKKNLEEILEYKKEILSKLLGEKKAFEIYKEKQEKLEEKKENEKENRLANEIFTRKFFNS